MKREVKFRGLSVDTGEWVYGGVTSLSHTVNGNTYIVSSRFFEGNEEGEYNDLIEVNPESVGQYTGLKDKNGVEIYEGDIYSLNGFNYQIVFDNGAFCITHVGKHSTTPINWKPETEDDCMVENFSGTIAIIGNIHQTPSLS